MLELAEHSGLGDRVVGVQGHERAQVALPGVHPIRCDQDQPVRGPALAVSAVGELAQHA